MNTIKVATTYSSGFTRVNDGHPIKTEYYFFKYVILSNKRLGVRQLDTLSRISISKLEKYYDGILVRSMDIVTRFALKNVRDYIITITESCDLYCILVQNVTGLANNFKIEWFFDFYPSASFHEFYLKHFQYDATHMGLESPLGTNEILCKERTTDKMTIYDMTNEKLNIVRMLCHNIYVRKLKTLLPSFQYRLRMKCNNLLCVVHTYEVGPSQSGKQLSNVLFTFRTTIVAMTTYPAVRHKETSATECLTFMESIKRKHIVLHLGFTDNKNDVFVNETDYLKKSQEYLDSKDSPRLKKMVHKGRKHVLENLSNNNGIEKLVNIMCKVLGEKNAQV